MPNSIGNPPARCTPSFAAIPRRCNDRLHGVISFQLDAIPIWGLAKSSSRMPTARSIPRAAARSIPSVTSRLRGFRSVMGPPFRIRSGHATNSAIRRRPSTVRIGGACLLHLGHLRE